MGLTTASGIIFLVCLIFFIFGYRQEKRKAEREACRPSRTMHNRLAKVRHEYKNDG